MVRCVGQSRHPERSRSSSGHLRRSAAPARASPRGRRRRRPRRWCDRYAGPPPEPRGAHWPRHRTPRPTQHGQVVGHVTEGPDPLAGHAVGSGEALEDGRLGHPGALISASPPAPGRRRCRASPRRRPPRQGSRHRAASGHRARSFPTGESSSDSIGPDRGAGRDVVDRLEGRLVREPRQPLGREEGRRICRPHPGDDGAEVGDADRPDVGDHPAWTSYVNAPLPHSATPCPPTTSESSSSQRGGRAVTKTTGMPAASVAASTARCAPRPSHRTSAACRRGRWPPAGDAPSTAGASYQPGHPPVRVVGATELDIEEGRAQLCCDRAGLVELMIASPPSQASRPIGVMTAAVPQAKTSVISPRRSRRATRRSTRGARPGVAAVGGDLEQRRAGHPLEDRAGRGRGDDLSVA